MEYRGIVAILIGTAILFWPRSHAVRASRKREERLAQLRAGADERYFEERRALESYRPVRREAIWRLAGAALLLAGLLSQLRD